MENLFSHNPTPNELVELTGSTDTVEELYVNKRSESFIILDLALLFEMRNDIKKSNLFWDKIPKLKLQYQLGFDDLLISAK